MQNPQISSISNFIWNIADSVLRDHYMRGKYRDVILPMTVIRRLDAVLAPTKEVVLAEKERLERSGVPSAALELRLTQITGVGFYNTSRFTLASLSVSDNPAQLRSNFEDYLNGFSANVRDHVLANFKFHNQLDTLVGAGILGALVEKFISPSVNFSPNPVLNEDGEELLPGLDNHAMGTVFEDLVRRFNEENNEEAGEHWTPRDAVELMAQLVFEPIKDDIQSTTYTLYDGAAGTGGMLTVAEAEMQRIAQDHGKEISTHLFGQEVNAETYAICVSDMLMQGVSNVADNIKGPPNSSTLSNDAFPERKFDFMLSNPPYGKNWSNDLAAMGGKIFYDPRFVIGHAGNPEYSLKPRSSDGQMLFLANMLSKMKTDTPLGSRIAEVHNGSSLFTGDAGQGESNIRRWIIENDWLEAIVALPLNMFYNTGIATYIWILTNKKDEHRKGYVQLIDATEWYRPLRKNLGQKNCELSETDRRRIVKTFLDFEETEHSKIFPNKAFGYWKVTVERPLRLVGIEANRSHTAKEIRELKVSAERSEDAPPLIKKVHRPGTAPNALEGLFEMNISGEPAVVEYEPDTELRDTEQIPSLCEGGIEGFLRREVLPYAPDAWYKPAGVKIGYEISFTRHFYKPQPMRPLEAIRADILELERESEGLLADIIGLEN